MAAQKTVERVSDPAEREACPECDGRLQTDDSRGETSCSDCGLIVDDTQIDRSPNWYATDEKGGKSPRRHVGAPQTERMHDKGLATDIGQYRDGKGDVLPKAKRRQFHRLRRWDGQAKFGSKFARHTAAGLRSVQLLGSQFGLNESLINRACRLFKEAHDAGLCVGRRQELIVAVSVLTACREHGRAITADEIASVTPSVDRRAIWRTHSQFVDETSAKSVVLEPVDHVPRIASELGLSVETRRIAEDLCIEAAENALHSGRKPAGIAAGAVYLAGLETGERATQEAIAEAADATKKTLREQRDRLQAAGFLGGEN